LLVKLANGASLDLSIVPLDEVKPHEDTIPKILDSLVRDLGRTKEQRDPILVDKRTHTALDGMHRRAALEVLGAKFAVCAEYDYMSDSVKLERWLRYFIAPSEDFLSQLISLLQFRHSDNFRAAAKEVDSARSKIALLSADKSYVSEREWGILEVYDALGAIDKLCADNKIELEFATENSKYELFTSEAVHVLYPEKLTKKDVLEMVRENRVFPCKTTRHIVPARPMGLFFPLEKLQNSSKSDCSDMLENIVNLSKIEIENRDVWYEGRRYSEPLAIFRKSK
jgi:L-serine kinase (ADP)